ncbi:bifunctional hydroxymethylpyrimidine kinase/phosphomethylpyrimidine kinase [Sphingomonas sp. PB4P5]|uniref:bifunctional hydroxymethylpyrimidine kinase/phosphomethylpyrimidine kinase n=1 Tax=Parasphingomonas puruogangriensis TaxID=3096155 RepID=UPI002FC5977A
MTPSKTPRILIIAGSDSGGGAGIQADIKTVTMLGGHAMTAVTAITAQNTLGVQAVMPVPTEMVLAQIESCISDIGVDAVKIGMIGSAETAHAVADRLERLDVPIVFDPVMVATSGSVLADAATIAAFERLMAIATVTTPNLPELEVLEANSLSLWEREGAAERRKGEGEAGEPRTNHPHPSHGFAAGPFPLPEGEGDSTGYLLVKGGHAEGPDVIDGLLRNGEEIARWTNPRITTRHSHGTGCTLASAIATGLGAGLPLTDAIDRAIAYVRAALTHAPGLGQGHGPMGHALGLAPYDRLTNA